MIFLVVYICVGGGVSCDYIVCGVVRVVCVCGGGVLVWLLLGVEF